MRCPSGERGSGSVLVIGLVAAVVVLAGSLAVLGQAGVVRAQAQRAADLSALAGAASVALPPGLQAAPEALAVACETAELVAARNGAHPETCTVDGNGVVEVQVVVRSGMWEAVAVARAGRPVTGTGRRSPRGAGPGAGTPGTGARRPGR